MKEYLKIHNPRITLFLIGLFFISNLISLFFSEFSNAVLLYPTNLRDPVQWYRLLTYPLFVGGILSWLHNSVVLYATGLIIENRLKKGPTIFIILISIILGGLVTIIVNQADPYNRAIASPTMISWGFWSAAVVTGVFYWKSINIFEKIILGLCILSLLNLDIFDIGFLAGQITVIISVAITAILVLIRKKNRP